MTTPKMRCGLIMRVDEKLILKNSIRETTFGDKYLYNPYNV